MSLRVRFALILAVISITILSLVAVASFQVLGEFLEQDAEAQLASFADDLHFEFEDGEFEVEFERSLPPGVHYRVILGGRVLASDGAFPDVPLDARVGYTRYDEHQVLVQRDTEEGQTFLLQVATDATGVQAPLQAYIRSMAWILPFATLLIAFASWVVAGRLTSPLAVLEAAASRVETETDLKQPMPGNARQDEIGRLARTLQDAFARVARTLEREQSFTRAAAHDLRTPLTAIRTRIQATLARPRSEEAYRTTLREIDQDVERLASLTNHLLLLAREELHVHVTEVDLGALVADVVERTRMRAPSVDIDVQASSDTVMHADPALITHVVQNLLDNAVMHGAGADVRVDVDKSADGEARLRVRDEGPGVEETVLDHLSEAFFQADEARSHGGSGLGLAVTQRLVSLMKGRLRLASKPGQGFTAEVLWPAKRTVDGS